MHKVVLLLGCNLGNKEDNLRTAKTLIEQAAGKILECSQIYKSSPWGFDDPNDFLNQTLVISTALAPDELLASTQAIEKKMGRAKLAEGKYESRIIDIDILYFDNEVVDTEDLKIPHNLLHQRRFTLLPLVELEPEYKHPLLHKTNSELLANCIDRSEVSVWSTSL